MAIDPIDNLDNMGVAKHTQRALINNSFPKYKSVQKDIVFDGGTLNGIGDISGTNNPYTLFDITGTVELSIFAVCKTNLAGAGGTVEVGITGAIAVLIAQTTATDIDVGEIWHDDSPDAKVELTSVIKRNIVTSDVILTAATADITAGKIQFICMWTPISSDGNVA